MTSIQGKVIRIYLLFKRRFSSPQSRLDISRERTKLKSQVALLKTLVPFKAQSLNVNGVRAEWIQPAGELKERVLLYLHGGAYFSGSIEIHRIIAANTGWAAKAEVLLIDYRLAPENPFPAALEDAQSAYGWLLEQGYSAGKLIVAGDSAGGGLALALMLELRDQALPLPSALVCYSPWTDLAMAGESYTTNKRADLTLDKIALRQAANYYLGNINARTPKASPIYGDLSDLPPMLIQVGSDEILLSDSTDLAGRARSAGVEVKLEIWPGMQHEWQFIASLLPEGRQALENVARYIDQKLP
jgi:epsilon-lactone hydrolase